MLGPDLVPAPEGAGADQYRLPIILPLRIGQAAG